MKAFATNILLSLWSIRRSKAPVAVVADLHEVIHVYCPTLFFEVSYIPGRYVWIVEVDRLGAICANYLQTGSLQVHPYLVAVLGAAELTTNLVLDRHMTANNLAERLVKDVSLER